MGAEPPRGGRPFLARRFRDEADFRGRVELAERLGVPPSQLDGREPAEETRHFYDRRGRLVRSVTIRQPRFTDEDRAELLALQLYRDGLCPLCGRSLEVCTAMEGQGSEFEVSWQVCNAQRRLSEFKRATYTPDNYPDREAHLLGTTQKR